LGKLRQSGSLLKPEVNDKRCASVTPFASQNGKYFEGSSFNESRPRSTTSRMTAVATHFEVEADS
jgi:hypothetical protein